MQRVNMVRGIEVMSPKNLQPGEAPTFLVRFRSQPGPKKPVEWSLWYVMSEGSARMLQEQLGQHLALTGAQVPPSPQGPAH